MVQIFKDIRVLMVWASGITHTQCSLT